MEKVRIALKAASMVMWLNMDVLETELKAAEEALEKQKAKKIADGFCCPDCGNVVGEGMQFFNNYCAFCGQKLERTR